MLRTGELIDAMGRLMENRPELRGRDTPNVNELRYFLISQGYIDFDPTDVQIGVAHFMSNLDAFFPQDPSDDPA